MGTSRRIKVVVVRGHIATPWELRQWEGLPADRFEVSYLRSDANAFDEGDLSIRPVPIGTTRDRLPRGRLFDIAASVMGERYVGLEDALAGADIVHAEELFFWFAAEAVRGKGGAKVVQTVWETIPMLDAYRGWRARRNRQRVLAGTDLFLPTTERARDALLLEGVEPERIEVSPPGIDVDRFARAEAPAPAAGEHVILSPGRLVWEKGHQDVLRAVAALDRGLVGEPRRVRLKIVGSGPEEARLRAHAAELGVADRVEIGSVPYDDMPGVFASASCIVLASLPLSWGSLHILDPPRAFWEEQFGMVLAEAMAAGLPIIASTSGAIPEVVGDGARYIAPGDWMGIARELAAGPLTRAPGERFEHDPARVQRFSIGAAADRLAAAYERLLAR